MIIIADSSYVWLAGARPWLGRTREHYAAAAAEAEEKDHMESWK